jgi:hypothetical protein
MAAEIENISDFEYIGIEKSNLTIEEKLENAARTANETDDSYTKAKLARSFIKTCLLPEMMDEDDAVSFIKLKIKERFGLKGQVGKSIVTELLNYFKKLNRPLTMCKCSKTLADVPDISECEITNPLETDYDEDGISTERQTAAKEKALDIMKNGDPLDTILKNIAYDHIGDEKFQELFCVAVASQSCINTAGIQPSLHGSAGSGKSHAVKVHLHRIRAKHKLESTLSAKAAYYHHLKPGHIIFSDDTEPTEALEETIKRSTTNFQEKTIHTTVHDGNAETLIIPARIMWVFTSVNNNGSDQLSDRQVKCNTNESEGQRRKALEKQLEEAGNGKYGLTDVDDDILVCRYIYDEIKENTFRVRIPYYKQITMHSASNLRNTQRFLDMVKGYTIIYHKQRETDENGCLLATEWDFELAKSLFDSQLENAVTKLTEKERRIRQFIADHSPCTISEIANGTGFSYRVVREAIKGNPNRVSGGLLEKVVGLTETRETHTEKINDEESISKTSDYYSIKNNFKSWDFFENKFVELVYK